MSEWTEYLTADLLEQGLLVIGDGYRAKNIELSASKFDGLPFARVGNINEGFNFKGADYFPTKNLKKIGEKISKVGDVVFTSKGTVGRFAFVNNKSPLFVYSPQLCFWRSLDQNFILPRFLLYWMQSREFFEQADAVKSQTDMADYVNLSDQRKMKITLPEINEQTAIASVLSSLDDKIDLLHFQNVTLEKMAETLFRQWFVEEAKEEWEEMVLGDFFPVITGKKDANYSTEDGKYPFFTCSKKTFMAPNYSFDAKAILLAGNGDFNVKRYTGKFEAYQRTYVLIPHEEKYHDFLYVIMKFFLNQITEGHQGSVINFLTKGMITDFKILLPKNYEDELTEFKRIFNKVDININQIRTLKALRDTLLSKLMSGEVRVS